MDNHNMDEKPKHKRGQSLNEIDFVTALSIEECVERLERGPAHTLDYRLTVRTDGERFKVEVLGNTRPARAPMMIVLAEMNGHLHPWTTGTQVMARSETKYRPHSPYWAFLLVPLSCLYASFLFAALGGETVVCIGLLIVAAGVISSAVLSAYVADTLDKVNRQIPDLRQWLMQQIYESPGLPEE